MQLDVPTLMALGSFVTASAGTVLLIAWLQNRNTPGLAIWGISDLLAAGGILALMMGAVLHLPSRPFIGATLLALSQGLAWKAARTFDGKPAPVAIVLLGMIAVLVADFTPGLQYVAGSVGPAVGAAYITAIAASLWLGRADGLPARWPLIVIATVHVMMLMLGIYSFYNPALGADLVPSVMSLFGFIHFESMVFFVGTAVFILSFVRERAEAASRAAAKIDPLTGISNRAAFMDGAERIIERGRRDGAAISVIMLDLDRFKDINDTYGHAVGDEVIKTFCQVTIGMLRPGDMFGRIGGEEFAVVLSAGSEAAASRADRIRATFAASCRFARGFSVNATVSAGIAASDGAQQTALTELLEAADKALYGAKTAGRNRIERACQPSQRGLATVIRVA